MLAILPIIVLILVSYVPTIPILCGSPVSMSVLISTKATSIIDLAFTIQLLPNGSKLSSKKYKYLVMGN